MKPRIFISYKRRDAPFVIPIVDEIKRETGADCWIDLEGIESGDQFQKVIIDAIDCADIVIFMLSENFVAPYQDEITGEINLKKQTFPEKEVMYALRRNKRLIPVSIDGTTIFDCKWLEFNCSGLDCIYWYDELQQQKLLNNLQEWIGNSRKLKEEDNEEAIVRVCGNGTCVIESHPGYACLHIHASENCEIFRFGAKIGEINASEWGILYLKMGRHELTFHTQDMKVFTRTFEIPSVDYTDFIYVSFSYSNSVAADKTSSYSKCNKIFRLLIRHITSIFSKDKMIE